MQATRCVYQCDICKATYMNRPGGDMQLSIPVLGGGVEYEKYSDLCQSCIDKLFALASNRTPTPKPASHEEWLLTLSEAAHPAAAAIVFARRQHERESCWSTRLHNILRSLEMTGVSAPACEGLIKHGDRLATEELAALCLAVHFIQHDISWNVTDELLVAVAGMTPQGKLIGVRSSK